MNGVVQLALASAVSSTHKTRGWSQPTFMFFWDEEAEELPVMVEAEEDEVRDEEPNIVKEELVVVVVVEETRSQSDGGALWRDNACDT